MARTIENECVGCERCVNCGRKEVMTYRCDDCGDCDCDLYEYEGEELCGECVLKRLPKVKKDWL